MVSNESIKRTHEPQSPTQNRTPMHHPLHQLFLFNLQSLQMLPVKDDANGRKLVNAIFVEPSS
jgi:hypothetical protein